MTEQLEKEAEDYAKNLLFVFETDIVQKIVRERVRLALIDVLEPREKQIKALGKRCLQLQKDKGELIDKVRELEDKLANADYQLEGRDLEIKELEAQLEQEKNLNQCLSDHNEQLRELIEKIKCCFNCKHSRTEYEHCKTDKHEKWEIKEK